MTFNEWAEAAWNSAWEARRDYRGAALQDAEIDEECR